MIFAKNFARNYEKKIILGTSDAWSMSHLSQRTSEPCAHQGNNSRICHILCVKATTLIVYSFLFILDSFILNYLLLMNDNSQALKRSSC